MSKRAVILAGGMGTRLRPYTVVLPKPLMPIAEYPILEVIVRQLVHYGFDHVTMAVNHQAEIIKAFFQNGEKWGIRIDYSLETKALSTMGPLSLIKNLPENFLIMNGDVLTDLNFSDFYQNHVEEKNIFTVSGYTRKQNVDFGVLETNNQRQLVSFKEKPSVDYLVSMGVYMANHSVLDFIPKDTKYGFDNLMLDLMSSKNPPTVRYFEGYWMDIGRPDDYAQAIENFDAMRGRLLGK